MFTDATNEEIEITMQQSWEAFFAYRKLPLKDRAFFMRSIAVELKNSEHSLIKTAMEETNLTEARLKNELTRTIFQLNSYADFCDGGQWLEVRIDTAIPDR